MNIEIKKQYDLVDYEAAVKFMQLRVNEISRNLQKELIWFLNHDHIYTKGTSANENEILKIAEEYIAKTYTLHYTGKKGTQTLDLIESIGDAEAFCRSNAIKYLSRFGKKDGKSKSDLLKAIHYCTLLYHFSGLTNESIDSNETI